MTTRQILTLPKSEVIKLEIENLNTFKSYKEGLRNAEEQSLKNYETQVRSLNQKRWFKIILQENHPDIVWSLNGSLTMLVYTDGNINYNNEIPNTSNICRVIGASSRDFISFYGTIEEVLSAVKEGNYTHEKSSLLSPVEFYS